MALVRREPSEHIRAKRERMASNQTFHCNIITWIIFVFALQSAGAVHLGGAALLLLVWSYYIISYQYFSCVQKIFAPVLPLNSWKTLLFHRAVHCNILPRCVLYKFESGSNSAVLSGQKGCGSTGRCNEVPRGLGTNRLSSSPLPCQVAHTQETGCHTQRHTLHTWNYYFSWPSA